MTKELKEELISVLILSVLLGIALFGGYHINKKILEGQCKCKCQCQSTCAKPLTYLKRQEERAKVMEQLENLGQ